MRTMSKYPNFTKLGRHGQKGVLRVLAKLLYFEIRTVSDVALVMFLNGSAAGTQHSSKL